MKSSRETWIRSETFLFWFGILWILMFTPLFIIDPGAYNPKVYPLAFVVLITIYSFPTFLFYLIYKFHGYYEYKAFLSKENAKNEKTLIEFLYKNFMIKDLGPVQGFALFKYDGQLQIKDKITNEMINLKYSYFFEKAGLIFHLGPANKTNNDLANKLKKMIKDFFKIKSKKTKKITEEELKRELERLEKESGVLLTMKKSWYFIGIGFFFFLLGIIWSVIENFLKYGFDHEWSMNIFQLIFMFFGLIIILVSMFLTTYHPKKKT